MKYSRDGAGGLSTAVWVLAALIFCCALFGTGLEPAGAESGPVAQNGQGAQKGPGGGTGQGAPASFLDPGEFRLALVAPLGGPSEANRIARTALRRIAQIQGIPFDVVEKPERLGDYAAAVCAAGPSNKVLTPAWRESMYAFVEDGGVLLVPGPVGSDIYPLLGIEGAESKRTRERISFGRAARGGSLRAVDPILAYIDHPRERTISIGNGHGEIYDEVIWSHGAAAGPLADVLASFEDGSAALVRSYYGRGIAYYLGAGFVETVLLPQTGGDYEAQRKFVNSVEPSADVIMLLVKALYEEYAPAPVYVSPIPEARRTALLLTHDVDAQTSFVDSLKFARLAEDFGTRSTFFINTKYFEDWMDIAYYSVPENLEAVRRLHERGHELGSHTVAHSREFDGAPVGSTDVDFDSYEPEKRITIHGETSVSKELLETDVAGQKTESFRAGYLAFPPELIAVLESEGYRYDSSFSANDVLTTFPYFALPERRPGAEESDVIEIPVTLDDALGFLTEETKEEAVEQWKRIVSAHAANETITVLLIHPSDTRDETYKLEAQRELMEHAEGLGAWIGCVADFGDFWRARHELGISGIEKKGGTLRLHLDLSGRELHPWIGLAVPRAKGADRIEVIDAGGRRIPFDRRDEGGKAFLQLNPGR